MKIEISIAVELRFVSILKVPWVLPAAHEQEPKAFCLLSLVLSFILSTTWV